MRILHKAGECIGCGVCAEVAAHYFEMNEEGLARVLAATLLLLVPVGRVTVHGVVSVF